MREMADPATGPIHRFLAGEHARLGELLWNATASAGHLDLVAYEEFRTGLLRHIAMEERVLLLEARRRSGNERLALEEKLRLQHSAIAALLVPTPTPAIIGVLRTVLADHNEIEEGRGGLYDICDGLAGDSSDAIVDRMRSLPEVSVAPHKDDPKVTEAACRTLRRAGFGTEAEQIEKGS